MLSNLFFFFFVSLLNAELIHEIIKYVSAFSLKGTKRRRPISKTRLSVLGAVILTQHVAEITKNERAQRNLKNSP